MGKAGKTVSKPIYNHITGELDPYEEVPATPIVIFEGLHPLYDSRVNAELDLSIYLDITDEVKFAWKAQRDIAERGATMEDVQKAIDARKPDFKAYVEPQKEKADIVIQVLMSDVVPDGSGKFLKVKFIQRKDCAALESAYLMDEGSTISWTPNSAKLASEVGVKLASYSEDWYGNEVDVVEMDGASTSSRRSSTWRARCATRAPSSTASSPSRSSRTRTRPARTTAPASCRPSAPSRSARSMRSSPSRLLHAWPMSCALPRVGYL